MDNEEINTLQLKRIADSIEIVAHNMSEILRLVKQDMKPKKKKVEGDSQAMNAFGD